MIRSAYLHLLAIILLIPACDTGLGTHAAKPLSAQEALALSHAYTPSITELMPGRAARSSAVSADGTRIVEAYSGGLDLRLTDETGRELATRHLDIPAQLVLMDPDGHVGAVLEDNSILVWQQADLSGEPDVLRVPGYQAIDAVNFRWPVQTPIILGRDTIAIGQYRQGRGLWRISDGVRVSTLTQDTGGIRFFDLSSDGELLAANQGTSVIVYRMRDGAFLGYLDNAKVFDDTGSNYIQDLAFTGDGKSIIVMGQGRWLHKMNIETAQIEELPRTDLAANLALAPDDATVAISLDQIRLRPMNVERSDSDPILTLPEDLDPYQGHHLMDMSWSKDGKRLAAHIGSYEGENSRVIVWDVAQKLPILDFELKRVANGGDLELHLHPIFTPDDQSIVMAFPDGNAFILPATTEELQRRAEELGISTNPTQTQQNLD